LGKKPIPANASIDPDLLPPEDQEVYRRQLGELTLADGPIKQDLEEEDQLIEVLEDESIRYYRYFAGFDTYDIKMNEGKTVRYTHMYPSSMQISELELMRAQVGSGLDQDEKPLNLIRLHYLKELWYDELGEFYLFNTVTKKPMTHDERLNCKDDWHLKTVLKSCLWRSNNDIGPRGKNLDLVMKHR
jgi:hypothetical protein